MIYNGYKNITVFVINCYKHISFIILHLFIYEIIVENAHIKSCPSDYRKCYYKSLTLSSDCEDYCVYFNIFNISMTNNIKDFNLEHEYYIIDFIGYTDGSVLYIINYFKMVIIFTITLLICIIIDIFIVLKIGWYVVGIHTFNFIMPLIFIPIIYITIIYSVFYSGTVNCSDFKNIDIKIIDKITGGTSYYNAIGRLSNGVWYEYYINRFNNISNVNNCYLYRNKLYSFDISSSLCIIGTSIFYIVIFILLLPTLIITIKRINLNNYVELLELPNSHILELTRIPESPDLPELSESPDLPESPESTDLPDLPESHITKSTELTIGPE